MPALCGAGGPGESRAWPGAAAELPLQRTLANVVHKLDHRGQLSSASATPVPARPSPGNSEESYYYYYYYSKTNI